LSARACNPLLRKDNLNTGEIKTLIANANWFSRLGCYGEDGGRSALRDLRAWNSSEFDINIDSHHAMIATQMDWLPNSRDEPDPIHCGALIEKLEQSEVQYREVLLETYKLALQSLRSVENPGLRSGRNDFAEAAKGAALYCVRMATVEVLAGEPVFWLDVLRLYSIGHWPCGLLPGRKLVAF